MIKLSPIFDGGLAIVNGISLIVDNGTWNHQH